VCAIRAIKCEAVVKPKHMTLFIAREPPKNIYFTPGIGIGNADFDCEIASARQICESLAIVLIEEVVFTRAKDDAEQTLAIRWKKRHDRAY
jgi:hypothetical protein